MQRKNLQEEIFSAELDLGSKLRILEEDSAGNMKIRISTEINFLKFKKLASRLTVIKK